MEIRKGILTSLGMTLILLLAMVLAACSTTDGNLPQTGEELPAEAVLQAQQMLADQLGVQVENIEIVSADQVEWPNACLGLGEEGEVCADVVTPGWDITFDVNGQQYQVRTDELGQTIRFENLP